ncbi:LANO_0C06766g1_1 [Lachancea nothofagi CBS 11611]|uniref:LANO_0C06766g1_1 n=1 Tax=Lachancea nothofagi CBS 11611 TaxID=1266666 RepID=A0A1G4J831_9SACH|nr:LANO_0C06766g1_1 [Lachancea nothofagi CBS 11611]
MKRALEIEQVHLEDYLEEFQLQQLSKSIPGPAVDPDLAHNWHYQYVVSWLYNVCDSAFTAEQGKPFFSNIAFDEKLLLQDLKNQFEENLYTEILEQLLKTVTQNKKAQLKEWDVAMKYNLAQWDAVLWYSQDQSLKFRTLSVGQQFDVLYACVKYIERKNQGFRMYLSSHLHMFQFPECVLGERHSLYVLPGGKVVERTMAANENAELRVPIKFRNCSVRYENEDQVEVFQLDFGPEIDDYLSHIALNFTVLTATWDEYLEYVKETTDQGLQEFLTQQLPAIADNELNGRRLCGNRERERSMAELLVRRKRSSRLVAREEDTRRRDLEAGWLEKLDERDQCLRARQRAVAKASKAIKDAMWTMLWERFEADVKVEKLRRRTIDSDATSQLQSRENDAQLSDIDLAVLENGPKYHQPLIQVDAPVPEPLKIESLELPDELLITREDLSSLANHGISAAEYTPDSTSWGFQCPCNVVAGLNLNDNDAVRSHTLVCCDSCLRWQHLECQQDNWITLLGEARQRPLQRKDFATVTLGMPQRGQRRSTRHPAVSESKNESENSTDVLLDRPVTRKASPSTNAAVLPETFICGWCMQALEKDLRLAFASELTQTRTQQLKLHEDRERRKKLKEERNKASYSTPTTTTTTTTANANNAAAPAPPFQILQRNALPRTLTLPSQL